MVLILPFGMMSGYLTVAVAYLLTKAGVSVENVAELIAISFIPHTWKFLWAPVADTTLGRKTWYVIACVLSAVGFCATGAFPATRAGLAALTVVVVVANVAVTFLGMSVESLMAYEVPDDEKGRAGGWFQAGNLGGAGLGGGADCGWRSIWPRLGWRVWCSAWCASSVAWPFFSSRSRWPRTGTRTLARVFSGSSSTCGTR